MKLNFSLKSILFVATLLTISTAYGQITFHESHIERRKSAPYSDAVQVGNLYFLTGQVGFNNNTMALAEGGVQAETKQTILNIQEVLKQHGMTLDNVVKCTVILSDINDFKAFNEIYQKYFPKKPARTTFAAAGLAIGAKIEIEVVAAKE